MNKKTKVLISSICVGVMAISCFVGCVKDGGGINETKTQLYVNNYNRGFGDEWLYKAAERFEALHAEDVYEEGKKGVEIIVDPNDSSGSALLDKIESSRGDVFFSEHVYIHEFVSRGLVADVTEEVTSVLSQYGENRSIEDKMTAEQKSYYNINGKYYGVPHYANYMGIICDVDFFDENDLWFKAKSATDGTTDGFISTAAGETVKSAGPDGQLGTFDDGFPTTYDEFFQLCDKIADGIGQPIIWAGFSQEDYLQTLMTAMQADFEGLEQMSLNYNFNGVATHLVDSIAADGTITYKAPTEIKNSNGYEVTGQAGKYYATKFIKTILENENYYNVNHSISLDKYGYYTVLYNATDGTNKRTYQYRLNVIDFSAPEIKLSDSVPKELKSGEKFTLPQASVEKGIDATIYLYLVDAQGVYHQLSNRITSVTFSDVGTYRLIYLAVAESGASTTCVYEIVVK